MDNNKMSTDVEGIENNEIEAESSDDLKVLAASPAVLRATMAHLEASSDRYSSMIQYITTSNSSDVSFAAIKTISSILTNILTYPKDKKYRAIKLTNKIFMTKIEVAIGAADLLLSAGFEMNDTEGVLELPFTVKLYEFSELQMMLNKYIFEYEESRNIDSNNSNKYINPIAPTASSSSSQIQTQGITSSSSSTVVSNATTDFDPYKPAIFRTAIQPRGGKSVTEMKLDELRRKQKEIEGDIPKSGPELEKFRKTTILSPHMKEEAAMVAMSAAADERGSIPDGRILAQGLASKIKAMAAAEGGDGSSDAPLQTRAIRDLQAAKKTKVYTQTLVKVKFPDRMVLQGFFHPRELVQSLYPWVLSCLRERGDGDTYQFELYTTPPRKVLESPVDQLLKANSGRNKVKYDDDKEVPLSFSDLSLVPAAVIYVAWKKESTPSSSSIPNSTHSYFSDEAISVYMNTTDSIGELGATVFPVSTSLIASTLKQSSNSSKEDSSAETAQSKHGSNNEKKSKPKWLKI